MFMILNATSNNISVISWRTVLLVEETGVPEENHLLAASHWETQKTCGDTDSDGHAKIQQYLYMATDIPLQNM